MTHEPPNEDLSVPAVDVRKGDGVIWITFDRPAASNALTLSDCDRVVEVLSHLGSRPRAVVFRGAGERSFSAGMHLRGFPGLDPSTARDFITRNRNLLAIIRTAPFPTICSINGHCLGTGMGIALAADIRIAVTHATFGVPEIKVGVPSVCDIALLQQHVGLGMAKEMILTGDSYSAEQMWHFGLLNRLVEPDQLAAETQRMVDSIAVHTPTVVAAQKRLFEVWQNTTLTAGIDASLEVFAGVFAAAETSEQSERHSATVGRTSSEAS